MFLCHSRHVSATSGSPAAPPESGAAQVLDEADARPGPAAAGPSDWGSLVADLSRGRDVGPTWQIHDRTHLEFAVDYRPRADRREDAFEWEAFFFVPESLRLESNTYKKEDIYSDLRSYIRFAVPETSFGDLTGEPLEALRKAWTSGDTDWAQREVRLYACRVRAAGVRTGRALGEGLRSTDEIARNAALAGAARMVADAARVTARVREVLAETGTNGASAALESIRVWVDEDISRVIELLLATLHRDLERADAPKSLQRAVADAAVAEARHRRDAGLRGVGKGRPDKRAIEHMEFSRHVRKRFTSSVLWLRAEHRDPTTWPTHVLYAVAAAAAMAFAVIAGLLTGQQAPTTGELWMWVALVVVAYAAKDRIKAHLQSVFASMISKRFPDRRWYLRARERDLLIGSIDEVSGFVSQAGIPKDVLAVRKSPARHPLEDQARPETVLVHRKQVKLRPPRMVEADPRFDAVTEIFRLDLRRWLVHTDDPKREIIYADPESGKIRSATAPRVYNISVVYRLRRTGDVSVPWRRVRVVVTRKGIQRIERVET